MDPTTQPNDNWEHARYQLMQLKHLAGIAYQRESRDYYCQPIEDALARGQQAEQDVAALLAVVREAIEAQEYHQHGQMCNARWGDGNCTCYIGRFKRAMSALPEVLLARLEQEAS